MKRAPTGLPAHAGSRGAFRASILLIGAFALSALAGSCRAQIRGDELFPADAHLKPIVAREGTDAAVVQTLPSESRDPVEIHDRAVLLARLLRLEESESALIQLTKDFPDFVPGYLTLSRIYWIAGERKSSRDVIERLSRVEKIPEKKLIETASMLDESGRSEEAGILLQSLAREKRAPGEACLLMGKRAYQNGKTAEALEHFRCAVEAAPSNQEGRLAAGLLHAAAANYRLAAGYLEGIPDDEARFQLARAYAETDRVPQAIRVLQTIEKKDMASLELWGSLLLADDLGADLSPVLNLASENIKRELLRSWFNTENISGREEMTRSLQSLY